MLFFSQSAAKHRSPSSFFLSFFLSLFSFHKYRTKKLKNSIEIYFCAQMHDTCTYRKKKEGATKKNNKTVEGKEDYYNHKIRNKKNDELFLPENVFFHLHDEQLHT